MSEYSKGSHTMKVVQLGLEKRIIKDSLKKGFSAEALAIKLAEEGTPIGAHSIRKFIKKSSKARQELISKDINAAEKYLEYALEYDKEIKSILYELKEMVQQVKEDGDITGYNQLIGRIFQAIELVAKFAGDLKPSGSVDINIVYNVIKEDIEKKNQLLRKELFGDSKIIDVDFEVQNEDRELSEKINKE